MHFHVKSFKLSLSLEPSQIPEMDFSFKTLITNEEHAHTKPILPTVGPRELMEILETITVDDITNALDDLKGTLDKLIKNEK